MKISETLAEILKDIDAIEGSDNAALYKEWESRTLGTLSVVLKDAAGDFRKLVAEANAFPLSPVTSHKVYRAYIEGLVRAFRGDKV